MLRAMDSDQRTDQAEGVSVLEAAAALGLSQKSIYRKLKSGQLAGVKRRTTTGYEWVVYLSGAPRPTDRPTDIPDQRTELVHVGGPVGHADNPLAMLVDRLEQQAERIGRLEAERDAALARVAALEQPRVAWWRRLLERLPH